MKSLRSTVLVGLLLAACGSGGGFKGEFVEACKEDGSGSDELCDCMGEKADEHLSDEQKEYVLAGIRGDQEKAAKLQGEMGSDDMARVGAFMAGAFECGAKEAGNME